MFTAASDRTSEFSPHFMAESFAALFAFFWRVSLAIIRGVCRLDERQNDKYRYHCDVIERRYEPHFSPVYLSISEVWDGNESSWRILNYISCHHCYIYIVAMWTDPKWIELLRAITRIERL